MAEGGLYSEVDFPNILSLGESGRACEKKWVERKGRVESEREREGEREHA